MSTVATPESVLCAAYCDQAARYREAADLARPLAESLRAGADHAGCLERVMGLLAEVAAIEERVRPVKERWVAAGGRPGPELRAALGEVMRLIEQLARGLAEVEQAAATRHAALAPQVDAVIRGRAMRRAYGATPV